jgi:hypothetical protein
MRWPRIVGIALVGLSFVLYGALIAVPFLPLSLEGKVAVSSALVISGEASFWIGGFLVGRELVARYRRFLDPRRWPRRHRRSTDDGAPASGE